MTRKIAIGKGYRVKDGRIVPSYRHLDVSTRLKRQSSKRVRVAKSAQCAYSS